MGAQRSERPIYGFESLTPTEAKVVDLLCEFPPLTVAEIVQRLGVQKKTYYSYKQQVVEKLYLPNGRVRDMTAYLVRYKCSGKLWEGLEEW